MIEPKPKRVYAKRRDYEKEMETLATYCETAAELMTEFRDKAILESAAGGTRDTNRGYWDGQVTALKAVLARIGKK